jgi:hypothetical protein
MVAQRSYQLDGRRQALPTHHSPLVRVKPTLLLRNIRKEERGPFQLKFVHSAHRPDAFKPVCNVLKTKRFQHLKLREELRFLIPERRRRKASKGFGASHDHARKVPRRRWDHSEASHRFRIDSRIGTASTAKNALPLASPTVYLVQCQPRYRTSCPSAHHSL